MPLRILCILITAPGCLIHLAAAASAQSSPPATSLETIRPAALRAHMAFLADDLLEGRGTATRGYEIAAKYVAAQLAAAGLEPGLNGEWFQPVPLRRSQLDSEGSRLEVIQPDGQRRLVSARDYVMGGGFQPSTEVEAPVVFVGHGVTAPERGYDDYAGVDVRGKIVAYLGGAPATFRSEERAYYGDVQRKAETAVAHGAVGTLRLWSSEDEKISSWDVVLRSLAHTARYVWLEGREPHGALSQLRVNAWLGAEARKALFGREPAQAAPDALPPRVRITRKSILADIQSPNVVALLQGSDPRLRNEYVVFTAHLDHLGIGDEVNGDAIYNGAIDNASGVASLIEIARAFASMPERPRRSLLFVAVTAEEPGLLGSDYFVHNPPVPLDALVANINIDGTSVWPFEDLFARGAEHSTLARAVDIAAAAAGIEVVPDPFPEQLAFLRSDQYSFVQRGIPSLIAGATRSGEARRIALDWVNNRYHAPGDDMGQAMDFEEAARFTRLLLRIGHAVAQDNERPRWNPGSFYGERFGRPPTADRSN